MNIVRRPLRPICRHPFRRWTVALLPLLFALPPGEVVAEPAAALDWDSRFQTTYIYQAKPGFGAAYNGANSLSPQAEKSYTFSATAYLGWRPWQDGELYFNPEMTQGRLLSNLVGLGGMTNGEANKASGTTLIAYRARLFLRQTWPLGGGSEPVEADLNQLAGVTDKNRFVLTLGNFSMLDVIDDNAYAKDPRTQFLNWAAMTYAAYDYAADARGYGWGVAGEWYQGDWVLRAGRMTGPREPNGLALDYRLGRRYGDQFEIEHAHQLAGQPGRLRLLAWRNRALLAGYREALALAAASGGTPDILRVRSGERTKYGLGINLEQAVSERLGLFLRAMRADGRSETYAFTEADASLATGALIKGAAWGRADDSAGVALMRNLLSRDRRQYLEAGGLSFFIGDGALRYRPESIVEAFYSLGLTRTTALTLDYQRIANPAYNSDRGPVRVVSLRLHSEF